MALAAHADTVAGGYGLPSHTATGIVRSGFAARLGPVVECVGSPLDNRINKETAIVARTPLLHFLKTLSSDVTRCQGRDISAASCWLSGWPPRRGANSSPAPPR